MLFVLWLVALLQCLQPARAIRYLRTDSLLTCMENSQFSSTYFSVSFFPSNNSIYYQIDGMSTISGNVQASFEVIVYGLSVYQGSINLCDFDVPTICPLTSGHIDVQGTYRIQNVNLNQVPSIAYGVPDLDAYVQVHVYQLDRNNHRTGSEVACMQASLENGRTVQTRYAGWPIAVVSGIGLVVSSVVSLFGHSATASHISSNACSLFIYFQSLAVMAMMGVNQVPPIAAAWAQNFVWTLGIIKTHFMQTWFYWYIQSTGGSVTSILANESVISIAVQKKFTKLARSLFKRAVSVASGDATDVLDDSSLYTTNEDNVGSKVLVLRGIQRVAYRARIEVSNIFLTSITFFLFVGFILVFSILFLKAIVELWLRNKPADSGRVAIFRQQWRPMIKGMLFRLFNITFSQICLICMWEFARNDGAGCIAFAVIVGLTCWISLCYAAYRIIMAGRISIRKHGNPAYLLFGDTQFLNRFGFLYAQYKASKFYWVAVMLGYLFVKGLMIAVLQRHGKACACIVFAIELIYMVVVIWQRPFMDKRTNVFNVFIAVINFINSIFFMFYSNVFGQPRVVSSVAAIVYFILNAVFALILLIMTIVSCTLAIVHRNPDTRYEPFKDDRTAFISRDPGERKSKAEYELQALGAAAMRGHDRNSMLPDAASPPDSPPRGKMTNTANPFDLDEDYLKPQTAPGGANPTANGADQRGSNSTSKSSGVTANYYSGASSSTAGYAGYNSYDNYYSNPNRARQTEGIAGPTGYEQRNLI